MPILRVLTSTDAAALEDKIKTAFPQLHALNLREARVVAEPDVDLPTVGVIRLRVEATYEPDAQT